MKIQGEMKKIEEEIENNNKKIQEELAKKIGQAKALVLLNYFQAK